jgi:UDP-galactopyranose mutase
MYDNLVVGAGIFGLSFARAMADAGKTVLVIEKRATIGGNCHSEQVCGIDVHRHGPHIFHTTSQKIWEFINRFGSFYPYQHHSRLMLDGTVYSFPINLLTMNQLWPEVRTPADAAAKLAEQRVPTTGDDLESWCLRTIGRELYEKFVKGYTSKQWARPPSQLPSSIIKRLPVRLTYDDRYFSAPYQGIPVDGWSGLIRSLIDNPRIVVKTRRDFLADRGACERLARRIVYSGSPDELFDADEGRLEYRSLRFEQEILKGDFQGCSIMHYPDQRVPYNRIVEYKHFVPRSFEDTVIVREFPADHDGTNEPYYPINTAVNNALAARYVARAEARGIICGGRLGTYKYFNIDQCIGQALALADNLLADREENRN